MLSAQVDPGSCGAQARGSELGRLQANSKIENSVDTTDSNIAVLPKGGKCWSSTRGGVVGGWGACCLAEALSLHSLLLCPQRPQVKQRTGSLHSAAAWPVERQ